MTFVLLLQCFTFRDYEMVEITSFVYPSSYSVHTIQKYLELPSKTSLNLMNIFIIPEISDL